MVDNVLECKGSRTPNPRALIDQSNGSERLRCKSRWVRTLSAKYALLLLIKAPPFTSCRAVYHLTALFSPKPHIDPILSTSNGIVLEQEEFGGRDAVVPPPSTNALSY